MPRATADLDEGHDRRVAGTDAGVPAETPPGPNGFLIVGNARSLVRDPRPFYEAMSEYGDVISYSIPRLEFCTVLHPDLVERVLMTDNEKFGKIWLQGSRGRIRG
jgi:hypothetical protein